MVSRDLSRLRTRRPNKLQDGKDFFLGTVILPTHSLLKKHSFYSIATRGNTIESRGKAVF